MAQHVVISGAGSGVGEAVARAFAAEGAALTLLGRRAEPLEALSRDIGGQVFTCDVTDDAALTAAIADATAAQGPVRVAVANAGAATSKPFLQQQPSDLTAMLDVNLHGVANLWRACLPDMLSAGHGRLVAVASTAGLKGYGYVSGYCAAKHAVVGLTRALAQEVAGRGVTANAVCPGFVETPMLRRSVDNIVEKTGLTPGDAESQLRQHNPMQRFVQAEEVASAVLWLASAGASSVNGQALAVDGGET